jgi:hypothetical protein
MSASTLQTLDGSPFPVSHSASVPAADAAALAAWLGRAHRFLSQAIEGGGAGSPLALLVLDPADWAQHARVPVDGLPHWAGPALLVPVRRAPYLDALAVLLAEGITKEQRDALDAIHGIPNRKQAIEQETGAYVLDLSRYAALLPVRALGGLFRAGVAFPRRWLEEIFDSLCLHAYLAEQEPAELPVVVSLADRAAQIPWDRLDCHALGDYERLGYQLPPQNVGWFQLRFADAARTLYETAGSALLPRMRDAFRREPALAQPADADLPMLLHHHIDPALATILRTWPE